MENNLISVILIGLIRCISILIFKDEIWVFFLKTILLLEDERKVEKSLYKIEKIIYKIIWI